MNRRPTLAEWSAARRSTDDLFSCVRPGFLYERPIDRRHRLIFYLGHVDAFDWNQIARYGLSEPSFNPEFDKLFEAGIDPDSSSLPRDKPSDWPSIDSVRAYVQAIRERLDALFEAAPGELLQMAMEHRFMHAETLAYGLHAMSPEAKVRPEEAKTAASASRARRRPANQPVEIPGGSATLGRRRGNGFGWDNEFEEHAQQVEGFAIDRYKVTNGDYLEFVREGAAPPAFWTRRNEDWWYRGMFETVPLPLDHPVYVTWDEASAFARWRGRRLPAEAEFHRAAYGTTGGNEREYPWGGEAPTPDRGNFDFAAWDPVAVDAHPAGDSAFGVAQLAGNGWEWTSTPFAPFDGFQPLPTYPGYSANFFDGAHYVLKGGSPRTAAGLLRRSFRNWFRPDYPHVYATFRCVDR